VPPRARGGFAGDTEARMKLLDVLTRPGGLYRLYSRFEIVVSAVPLLFVLFIIVYSVAILAMTLFDDSAPVFT
jgi:hypothetical protein